MESPSTSNASKLSVNKFSTLIGLLLIVGILSTCDLSSQDISTTSSSSLVIGAFDKLNMLNPVLSNVGISSLLVDIVFDGLIEIDENMIVRPVLAASWDVSDNGLVWTFHLRQRVTFHDGTPFTANDVKFTLDAIGNPLYNNQFSHILAPISKVRIIDDHTIRINLRHPFPSLIYYLYFGILPSRIYKGHDLRTTSLNYRPIGTGPYRLVRWSEDELVFKANEAYFLTKPIIETVIVRAYPNQRATWAELIRGNVDFAWFFEPDTIQVIEKLQHLRMYSYVHPYYWILTFNNQNSYFREKSVRQALNYAIDKKLLLQKTLGGKGQVLSGLTYPSSKFSPAKDLSYPYDPAKALRLLVQNGWNDVDDDGVLERNGQEFRFTIYIPPEGFLPEKVSFFIQKQLGDLGIQTKIIAVPLSKLIEYHLREKQFDTALKNFVAIGDPDINYMFWSSSQQHKGRNFYNYSNQTVDRLLDLGRTSTNILERINAYNKFQREIFEDPPGIFLFWRNLYIVLPRNVRGVRIGPGAPFISIHKWYFEPGGGKTW